MLHRLKWSKTTWIGHMCMNCLLKHVEGKTEWRIEVTGRRGRRYKQLLNDLKETRGYSKLKEEALDRTLRRIGFGRGCGPVVRQDYSLNEWMNGWHSGLWCQYWIQSRSFFSYKPAFMNGEFGSLWKALWLFLATPLQFSGGAVRTCSCMIAGIPIEIQSQAQLTTLESDVCVPMGIVQRTKSLDCSKFDSTALLCDPSIGLY